MNHPQHRFAKTPHRSGVGNMQRRIVTKIRPRNPAKTPSDAVYAKPGWFCSASAKYSVAQK
ncbi:hypothetical protein EB235_31925 [Mesorhizobium loti R88b]|uniref:Uncharacterized protein n=1 Tax=Mesorhizobium loti R88b TaxID=935548 RepID=A0A6M7WYA4_RHILI|nr:hypothetical protein EB235_31925 [Mesorhizobium loti R88b]